PLLHPVILPPPPPQASRSPLFFFYHYLPPPQPYTLSLHDALPICMHRRLFPTIKRNDFWTDVLALGAIGAITHINNRNHLRHLRSEEHTSELQSRFDLVCRLLLEKKKKQHKEKPTEAMILR